VLAVELVAAEAPHLAGPDIDTFLRCVEKSVTTTTSPKLGQGHACCNGVRKQLRCN
jgi:hypothetical protein